VANPEWDNYNTKITALNKEAARNTYELCLYQVQQVYGCSREMAVAIIAQWTQEELLKLLDAIDQNMV
jgi:hypothetical protein